MTPPTLIPFGNDTGIVSIYPNGIMDIRVIAGQQTLSTRMHITHMKLPEDCYYSHITLATQKAEEYRVLDIAVSTIFLEGSIKHIGGSALDALIVQRFAGLGAGASPCHAVDNFSRKRGRIIAKGRLLKHLKAAERGGA